MMKKKLYMKRAQQIIVFYYCKEAIQDLIFSSRSSNIMEGKLIIIQSFCYSKHITSLQYKKEGNKHHKTWFTSVHDNNSYE